MAEIPVTKNGTVKIRGIAFPVQCILAAMAETGGIVVSDPALIAELDGAMAARSDNRTPDALVVEAIPATWFIPKRVKVHKFVGDPGRNSSLYLYFAVARSFHA